MKQMLTSSRPNRRGLHEQLSGSATMANIFDRLNQELETFGRKAQAAFDEGRFQLELIRLRRQRDDASTSLGKLFYQRERGKEVDQVRIDALLLRLDDIEAGIEKVEKQMGSIKAEATEAPAAEPAEAEATAGASAGGTPPGMEEGSPS
jgi:ribosomal protein L12E/L44/L45/RPP1/RPP2